MVYLWILSLVGLACLGGLRKIRRDTAVLQHQYRLFKLRDDLREAAMMGNVDTGDWVFLYLDSSITKTIAHLKEISFWSAVLKASLYSADENFVRNNRRLQEELEKPTNGALRDIYEAYGKAIAHWLVVDQLTLRLFWNVFSRVRRVQEQWRRVVTVLQTRAPETSTLQEFVPA
jgi:hypothetical protein